MVDLAKPAFKLGVAELKVGLAAHELQVSVTADKAQYLIREKAIAKVRVTHGGKPLAGAEVAFAAVDEGLLALRDNASWQLLDAMMRERAWGVETSTAQSEIIGRRHYGRKAVAAGGGGGRGATRELFDTLLVWKPNVVLDAQRRGDDRGAAQRLADELSPRRRRRRRRRRSSAPAAPASASRRTCRCSPACRRWCARAIASRRC